MKHISKSPCSEISWGCCSNPLTGRSGTNHSRCTKEVLKESNGALGFPSEKVTEWQKLEPYFLMQRFYGCKEWQWWFLLTCFFARNNGKKNVLYQEFQVLGIYCSCDLCAKPGDSQPSLYKWRLVAGNAFQIWSTVLYFLPGELRSSGVEIWREN